MHICQRAMLLFLFTLFYNPSFPFDSKSNTQPPPACISFRNCAFNNDDLIELDEALNSVIFGRMSSSAGRALPLRA